LPIVASFLLGQGTSYLVLGNTSKNRYLHIVVAIDVNNFMLWIITVYEPNLSEWEIGFKKRRRKK